MSQAEIGDGALVASPEGVTPPRVRGWGRLGLQVVWFGVVPLLVAVLAFLFMVPARMVEGAGFWLRLLGGLGQDHTIAVLVALFLLFSALMRYWRAWLPGAAHLRPGASRPTSLAQTILFAVALLVAASAGVSLRESVAESYRVLSGSMLPTLDLGDRIVVDKRAYGWRLPLSQAAFRGRTPRRGEIIVFQHVDSAGSRSELVKRVIGLPGDRVRVVWGRPIVNEQAVASCDAGKYFYLDSHDDPVAGNLAVEFLDGQAYLTVLAYSGEPAPAYQVGPDEVFVLGDNRDFSLDSRNLNDGRGRGVRVADVRGRVHRIAFGADPDGQVDPSTLWRKPGLALRLPGVDVSALKAGVEKCIRNPPPPTPAKPLSATAGPL